MEEIRLSRISDLELCVVTEELSELIKAIQKLQRYRLNDSLLRLDITEIRENIKDPGLTKCKNKTGSYFQPRHMEKALDIRPDLRIKIISRVQLQGTLLRFQNDVGVHSTRIRQKFSQNLKGVILQLPDFQHRQTGAWNKKRFLSGVLSSGVNPTPVHRKPKPLRELC